MSFINNLKIVDLKPRRDILSLPLKIEHRSWVKRAKGCIVHHKRAIRVVGYEGVSLYEYNVVTYDGVIEKEDIENGLYE